MSSQADAGKSHSPSPLLQALLFDHNPSDPPICSTPPIHPPHVQPMSSDAVHSIDSTALSEAARLGHHRGGALGRRGRTGRAGALGAFACDLSRDNGGMGAAEAVCLGLERTCSGYVPSQTERFSCTSHIIRDVYDIFVIRPSR